MGGEAGGQPMGGTRKLAAILAADVVGYSRLAGADEDRILARLRALRSDLIDPTIAVHYGRVVKRTGDGAIVEFRSVVDAIKCAIEIQNAMVERNAGVPEDRRIVFRIGIHVGDVVEESDGDLMGEGVNIAARLEGVAKPGAICLSEDAYRQVKSRLDLKVSDLGPTTLKNIAEPVRAYSLEVGAAQLSVQPVTSPAASAPRRWGWSWLVASVIAVLLLTASSPWFVLSRKPPPPAHLSVVVLPFANLSGDPAQDYFADSITDNLTTDLSRIKGSFVIARNTAFTYKGKNVDAKAIGKDLGVRYVLEGSVQREQNRVRVNAQLIDADTGAHIWADRFENDLSDLFKLQDQVVAQLANTLRYELAEAEATRAQGAQNPDAVDLAMRGWWEMPFGSPNGKEQAATALPLFERALTIDPENSEALAGRASILQVEYILAPRPGFDYDAAILGDLDKAIVRDPTNVHAYRTKGNFLSVSGRPADALRVLDTGLAIDPNFAPLLASRCTANYYLGRFTEAQADIIRAMAVSPRDPSMPWWFNLLADTEIGLKHFDAAADYAKKSIDGGFHSFYAYLNLAVGEGFLGHDDEAKAAVSGALRSKPDLSVKWLLAHKPVLAPAYDVLRKAGLPE